jgi:two-component system chemotaxis response regulator CheB
MPNRNIVVVGASAGGVEALVQLFNALPADLPAALFVVLHVPAYGKSVLPHILNRSCSLKALHPRNGELIQQSHIYIAPPDYHLLIHANQIQLEHGPRENGHRPAVDVLFRSAAVSYRQRVIGIILSGMLDDGTVGLKLIKDRGGIALVQNPEEALFDGMPRSAIANVAVDDVLKLDDIAHCLSELVVQQLEEQQLENPQLLVQNLEQQSSSQPLGGNDCSANNALNEKAPMPEEFEIEAQLVAQEKAAIEQGKRPNSASSFTCPDCGGVLWEVRDGDLLRFRCHIGHSYSLNSFIAGHNNAVETALWSAVRSLEEKAALARRMATAARENHRVKSANQFEERAEEAEQQAAIVRQVVSQQNKTKNGGLNNDFADI